MEQGRIMPVAVMLGLWFGGFVTGIGFCAFMLGLWGIANSNG
jgi:hypothetical protein